MKILLVIDQYDSGNNGTTISAQRFARALLERGHEIRVTASGRETEIKRFSLPPVRFLPIAQAIIRSQGMEFAYPSRKILAEAIAWADIIHFMMPFALARRGAAMARKMGKPATAAFHVQPENITSTIKLGHSSWANELLYTEFRDHFYNQFTHLHCPSEFIAEQLRRHGYTAQLHVISNGVDPSFVYRKLPKEKEFAGKILITMVGRLSEEKRQDVLIEAVAKSRYAEKIQILLAGQGPKRQAVEQLGSKLPNPPIIGFYPMGRLQELLAMSDLYVHAADVEIEAIACLEAVASGLVPVIADSPLSATPQFALDERSLFPAGDSAALAEKIDWWLDHPEERREMERRYAESAGKYSLASSIDQAERMFACAMEEQR